MIQQKLYKNKFTYHTLVISVLLITIFYYSIHLKILLYLIYFGKRQRNQNVVHDFKKIVQ